MFFLFAVTCFIVYDTALSHAATRYVGTKKGYYRTIQSAVNAAANGDVVVVSPGTYLENVDFLGKAITLRSTAPLDPNVVYSTIIDGLGGLPIDMSYITLPGAKVEGLTIQNGLNGIEAQSTHSFSVLNCVITRNTQYGIYAPMLVAPAIISDSTITLNGTGIAGSPMIITGCKLISNEWGISSGEGLTVEKCTVSDNVRGGIMTSRGFSIIDCRITDNRGSGISVSDNVTPSEVSLIKNCIITDNYVVTAPYEGGGIYISGGWTRVENCLVARNSASSEGGGMLLSLNYVSVVEIVNCTVTGNVAPRGSGIMIRKPLRSDPPVRISNTIVFGNVYNNVENDISILGNGCTTCYELTTSAFVPPIYWVDTPGGFVETGNINADPLFVGGGDYRLTANSPCIDVGEDLSATGLVTDLDGNVRPYGYSYDIGAYEFDPNFIPVPPDTTAPVVTGTDPADGAVNVLRDKTIAVTFSENIQAGTSYYQIALVGPSSQLAVTTRIVGNVLFIDPVSRLAGRTSYQFDVPAGSITDMAGNRLATGAGYYSFTTGLK